ncbi:uncharacterized protein [Argopecten irradians]|uniref:uncharacterized protein n=1 Tax=Argopecten irradians TaxID=31199 RepID=UPI0037100EBC
MACIRGRYRGYVGDYCCVPGCTNSRGSCRRAGLNVSFYKFPSDERRKRLWLLNIRRDSFVPTKYSRVCSAHFVGGVKHDEVKHPAYVPTIFDRNKPTKRATMTAKNAGVPEVKIPKRKEKSTCMSVSSAPAEIPGRPKMATQIHTIPYPDHDYVVKNVHVTTNDCDKINELIQENEMLKGKFLRIDNIKSDDSKFQFWTGLPNYHIFSALCNYLKTRVKGGSMSYWRGEATVYHQGTKKGPTRKLCFEDEFFLTLVKLKTGSCNQDLSDRFDVSVGHISNLFSTWINFLSFELKLLFEMQDSTEEVAECFKSFSNLKIILDCTELMVQKASNLDSRKKTFSNYKHHDTVKFLVGMSSNLAVNFVSKAWGGRASDKHITLSSEHLIDGLHCGDSVMADRGFTITDELSNLGVELLMPVFKGQDRPQFSIKDLSHSEYISKSRIHIERIIQRIKTFHILEQVIRLNMHDIIEQIFVVCAYMTNFQMPIIRKQNSL